MWQQWVNALIGLVIVATPFLNLTEATNTWLLVIGGVIVAALGFWGALEHTSMERESGRMMHRTQQ